MKYPENVPTAAEYLKRAIPLMVDRDLPINPVNYALWYNYVAERIPLLNRALDAIVENEGEISTEKCYELFDSYILSEYIDEHTATLNNISQVATTIISRLRESLQGSENFDEQLNQNIGQLEQAASLDDVTAIIEKVVDTTQNIRDANNQFQQKLQSANDEIGTLRSQLETVEQQAFIDQLTQINNRHAFDRKLASLISTEGQGLSLILADIDHFKSFNDNYGHTTGDVVLKHVGAVLKSVSSDEVFGARYGGEEFAIIVADQSLAKAIKLAEKLRHKVEKVKVKTKQSHTVLSNISASFGVAHYIAHEPIESLIDRADQALYRAKKNGRNRVEVFEDEKLSASV